MIFSITPLTDSLIGGVSVAHFLMCGGIATAMLVIALVLRELLDTGSEENLHHKHIISALDVIIHPLSFIFSIIVIYRVMEVLYL